jgi:co-chaperonin GroES (HSP10)
MAKANLAAAASAVGAMTHARDAREARLLELAIATANVLALATIPVEKPKILPTPLFWRIVVCPLSVSEKIGSIIKPDSSKEGDEAWRRTGMLAAVGEAAFSSGRLSPDGSSPPTVFPKVGDYVIYPKAAGRKVEYRDGSSVVFLSDDDLDGIIPNPEDVKAYT